MSDKHQMYASTAPSAPDNFEVNRGPPPPSYEESLKMNNVATTPHSYNYSLWDPYKQQQAVLVPTNYQTPGPSEVPNGYANPYQMHIQQQHNFYNASPHPSDASKFGKSVLYLAKGAKTRTTATGSISIPPPPPGCAPIPGQLAAMAGKPVVIKKKKRSFF